MRRTPGPLFRAGQWGGWEAEPTRALPKGDGRWGGGCGGTFVAGDEVLHFGVIQEKLRTEAQAMAHESQLGARQSRPQGGEASGSLSWGLVSASLACLYTPRAERRVESKPGSLTNIPASTPHSGPCGCPSCHAFPVPLPSSSF